ncbi:MAG TPA: UDP-N-acetylglucosamine 1-carboxyvinyltransferase [Anaerolineaceae bacterium]|jgi:UDP-N-acetylglucosamine 1-carboxyvinyltransferase|nr:UDP-N-acetylglucosamine 1-carboxyvinyltransferase [Anaerolineaceae bacterium]
MDKFIIDGGFPLNGELTPSGNKNAALPLLAACLLTDEPVILHNVPEIIDVQTMIRLLKSLNVQMTYLNDTTVKLDANDIKPADLDPNLCRKIRASILLAGPLISRVKEIYLPPPGGDVIGRRRLDTHILAFSQLGVITQYSNNLFHFKVDQLHGADILMDEASVTGTENAIMACVLAKGQTTLRNAASEPHIQELCQFLNTLGAKIENIGSNTLHITGVDRLHGGEFSIGPDYLEVVSYIGASVVTHGSIRIIDAGVKHLDMVKLVMNRLGVTWDEDGDDIIVPEKQTLVIEPDLGNAIPEISVMPWPSFPTDLMSIAIVLATQSKGSILFHDWMYPSRMYFTDKLVGMGAQIVLCDPHRCIVQGPTDLSGEYLESPDIRAGMALVLAALSAKGESVIRNVGQIDRGYQQVDEKLKKLGAHIRREKE